MPDIPVTEEDIVTIIEQRTADADTSTEQVRNERKNSLKFYNQDLYGDEQEGRSTFVSSECRDTVEWILPQLIEMFIGGDNPVIFSPRSPEDIEAAKQESDYVRYVINDQNDGFLNTYEWFKDALMSKNGVIKTYWDEEEVELKEEYEHQSFGEYAQLVGDEELKIEKITTYLKEDKDRKKLKEYKNTEDLNKDISERKLDISDPLLTIDVEGVRVEDRSQVKEYVVPPELFFVDNQLTSLNLNEARFIREDFYLSESDLLEMEVPQDVVDMLPSNGTTLFADAERQDRS